MYSIAAKACGPCMIWTIHFRIVNVHAVKWITYRLMPPSWAPLHRKGGLRLRQDAMCQRFLSGLLNSAKAKVGMRALASPSAFFGKKLQIPGLVL